MGFVRLNLALCDITVCFRFFYVESLSPLVFQLVLSHDIQSIVFFHLVNQIDLPSKNVL